MQTSPEIRFRIDRAEREQFEQVARRLGMDMNEMVKVFIRRAIAAGGFPFEMRVSAHESALTPQPALVAKQVEPINGVSIAYLSELGRRAFDAAYEEHVRAGRLPANSPGDDPAVTR